MRSIVPLFFILCMIAGCKSRKLPGDILPRAKMEAILWDMISTGEFLNGYVFPKDTAIDHTAESKGWYKKIFELHQITREQFEKSYDYYRQHPLVMKELLDSLNKREYIVDSSKIRKADSLKIITVDSNVVRVKLDSSRRLHLDSLRRKKIIKTSNTL